MGQCMNLRTLGKLMMSLGLVLLVSGLFMNTSVDGHVINVGLANDRLILVLIGGFLFVGGVIFYGVFNSKQSKEDEALEQHQKESKKKEKRIRAQRRSREISKTVSWFISEKLAHDFLLVRFVHAVVAFIIICFCYGMIFGFNYIYLFSFFYFILMICLAFRLVESDKAIYQLWRAAFYVMLLMCFYLLIDVLIVAYDDIGRIKILHFMILIFFCLLLIAGCYFVSQKFAKKISFNNK
jgi:preprotein translocase subunit SecE